MQEMSQINMINFKIRPQISVNSVLLVVSLILISIIYKNNAEKGL